MPHQAPDVKAIDPGDRAGRAAATALLTVAKHFNIVKAFGKLFIRICHK